jgi:hypothetical protein
MGNASYEVLEFRAVIKPEWTELFVRTSPASDGTLGVGGWYKKIIPAADPALPALADAILRSAYLTEWDRGTPD